MIEFSHWDIYFKPANDLFKTAAVYCERVIFLINYVFRYRFFTFLKHSFRERMEVCRNARCTSFFVHHYTNLFTFFKLRSFEDFFDLCVPSI